MLEQVLSMAAGTNQTAKQLYEFGPFRVDPEKELLLREGETVPLTPKTFQILLVLIRNKKEVGKGEGGKNEDDEYFDLLPNI